MADDQIISNQGAQVLTFDFRQEAIARGFNQIFCDTLPYGVYTGGRLEKRGSNSVWIEPLVCIIKSNEIDNNKPDKVGLRIETTEAQMISEVTEAEPYIVLRFGWKDEEDVWMQMLAVAWSDNSEEKATNRIQPFDIILGRAVFDSTTEISPIFDTTRRNNVFFNEARRLADQFRVRAREPIPTGEITVSGGWVNTSERRYQVESAILPVPPTTSGARVDIVIVNAKGEIKVLPGEPSSKLDDALPPKYGTYKVLAEIRREANRSNVRGSEIEQISDATEQGQITADEFLLEDSAGILPPNAKSLEAAINHIMRHSIAISPQEAATLAVVLRRNVAWGTDATKGEIWAEAMPVLDAAKRFSSQNKNVETILAEIAGEGRSKETLKSLADEIDELTEIVTKNLEYATAHVDRTYENNVVVHGVEIVTDLEYPLDDEE